MRILCQKSVTKEKEIRLKGCFANFSYEKEVLLIFSVKNTNFRELKLINNAKAFQNLLHVFHQI